MDIPSIDGMRKRGSCYLIYSSFYLLFRCLEDNKRNETLCVNHLQKCQMNTFWWWRWKCVYTNIISTTSLILNGPRDEVNRRTCVDTNCVHWAKSEINQPAPEERIIHVCQRSFDSEIGMTTTTTKKSTFFSSFYWIKMIVSSPDDCLDSD
jgi:hypothetical protein